MLWINSKLLKHGLALRRRQGTPLHVPLRRPGIADARQIAHLPVKRLRAPAVVLVHLAQVRKVRVVHSVRQALLAFEGGLCGRSLAPVNRQNGRAVLSRTFDEVLACQDRRASFLGELAECVERRLRVSCELFVGF